MQDERVRGSRPALGGERTAQLLLDEDRIVGVGDPDAIGNAQHVPIDRQPGHAECVAEHDVGGLAADARERD